MVDPLVLWTWTVALSLAVVAALVVARTRPERFAVLSALHVAGAAVLGTYAWELAATVPGAVSAFVTGLQGPQEPGPHLIPVAGLQLFQVIAVVVAVTFVLRRHLWAVVLAIGLNTVHVMTLAASWVTFAGSAPAELGVYQALHAVPPLVATAFFVRPLLVPRRGTASGPARAELATIAATRGRDGRGRSEGGA